MLGNEARDGSYLLSVWDNSQIWPETLPARRQVWLVIHWVRRLKISIHTPSPRNFEVKRTELPSLLDVPDLTRNIGARCQVRLIVVGSAIENIKTHARTTQHRNELGRIRHQPEEFPILPRTSCNLSKRVKLSFGNRRLKTSSDISDPETVSSVYSRNLDRQVFWPQDDIGSERNKPEKTRANAIEIKIEIEIEIEIEK